MACSFKIYSIKPKDFLSSLSVNCVVFFGKLTKYFPWHSLWFGILFSDSSFRTILLHYPTQPTLKHNFQLFAIMNDRIMFKSIK